LGESRQAQLTRLEPLFEQALNEVRIGNKLQQELQELNLDKQKLQGLDLSKISNPALYAELRSNKLPKFILTPNRGYVNILDYICSEAPAKFKSILELAAKDNELMGLIGNDFRNLGYLEPETITTFLVKFSPQNGKSIETYIDKYNTTALMWAAAYGNVSAIKALAEAFPHIDPNIRNKNGYTPLDWAAAYGNVSAIKALAEAFPKINPNLQDQYGDTPLDWAAQEGNVEVIKALAEAFPHIDPNIRNKDGSTPLGWAAYRGHDEAIKALAEAFPHIDPNIRNKNGYTPLDWAVGHGNAEAIKALAEAFPKINPNLQDQYGDTALFWAAKRINVRGIKALAEAFPHIDPNIRNKNGYTPLDWAAQEGNVEVIKALAEAFPHINPNLINKNGDTPLIVALKNSRGEEVVKTLLLNFKNIELPKTLPPTTTPAMKSMLAAYAKDPVQWLLDNHAEVGNILHRVQSKNIQLAPVQKQQLIKLACNEGKPELIKQVIEQNPKDVRYLNNKEVFTAITDCLSTYLADKAIAPNYVDKIVAKLKLAYSSSWYSSVDKVVLEKCEKLSQDYSRAKSVLLRSNKLEMSAAKAFKLLNQAILEQDHTLLIALVDSSKKNGRDITELYPEDITFKQRLEQYAKFVLKTFEKKDFEQQREQLQLLQDLDGGANGKIFSKAVRDRVAFELDVINSTLKFYEEESPSTSFVAKEAARKQGSKEQGL
jgi:ankyrin repeat protein